MRAQCIVNAFGCLPLCRARDPLTALRVEDLQTIKFSLSLFIEIIQASLFWPNLGDLGLREGNNIVILLFDDFDDFYCWKKELEELQYYYDFKLEFFVIIFVRFMISQFSICTNEMIWLFFSCRIMIIFARNFFIYISYNKIWS